MRLVNLTIGVIALASAFAIGRATALPVAQVSAQSPAVRTFSHFECYKAAVNPAVQAQVDLKDQFQEFQTPVGPSDLFCTPVTKTLLTGHPLRVPRPADHLTCYHIDGPTIQQQRNFINQLQRGTVQFGSPAYLCVPTHKFG
jgi:hypothetical protein